MTYGAPTIKPRNAKNGHDDELEPFVMAALVRPAFAASVTLSNTISAALPPNSLQIKRRNFLMMRRANSEVKKFLRKVLNWEKFSRTPRTALKDMLRALYVDSIIKLMELTARTTDSIVWNVGLELSSAY